MAKKKNTIHLSDEEIRALHETLSQQIYLLKDEEYFQWQRDMLISVMNKMGYVEDKDGSWVLTTIDEENRARIISMLSMNNERITLINPDEVIDYLIGLERRCRAALALIVKIIGLKEKYFGGADQTELVLQINKDPEINNPYLKFYIRQDVYEESFMDKIDKLQNEYFNELEHGIWILVTTDFKKRSNPHKAGVENQ